MKKITFLHLIFIVGCSSSPKPSSKKIYNYIYNVNFSSPGEMVKYNPLMPAYFPGTIFFDVDETHYIEYISDFNWLIDLDNIFYNKINLDLWHVEMPKDTEDRQTELVKFGPIDYKFLKALNHSLNQSAVFKSSSKLVINAFHEIKLASYISPIKRNAVQAFNEFKKSQNYNDFKNNIIKKIGERKGKLFVINKIKYVNSGSYTIHFRDNLTKEDKAIIKKMPNFGSNVTWDYEGKQLTKVVKPSNELSGFVIQWEYREIVL